MKSSIMKTGATLILALSMAAPVALSSGAAMAATHGQMGKGNMMGPAHKDPMHDKMHRPAMRTERRPPMPRGGHYRYRTGNWAWHSNHWDWVPGLWIKF